MHGAMYLPTEVQMIIVPFFAITIGILWVGVLIKMIEPSEKGDRYFIILRSIGDQDYADVLITAKSASDAKANALSSNQRDGIWEVFLCHKIEPYVALKDRVA